MSHYYSEEQNVPSNPSTFIYTYQQHSLSLKTDSGVFSKGGIDFGSNVLINVFLGGQRYANILDVGCGYGPMGLMTAKVWDESHVTMVDVNERALELARFNAAQNNIDHVEIYKSSCLDGVTGMFDAVITNPPIRAGKEIVHRIFEQSIAHLNHGGALFVVIQKKQGMPSAKKRMEELFGNVEVIAKDKGYYILKSVKG